MRAVRSYAPYNALASDLDETGLDAKTDCSCASGNVEFREDLHDNIGCATIRFEQPSANSHIE